VQPWASCYHTCVSVTKPMGGDALWLGR